jgi:hypothetical protein
MPLNPTRRRSTIRTKPDWYDSIQFVCILMALAYPDPDFDPQELQKVFKDIYPPLTQPILPPDYRLAYVTRVDEEHFDGLPSWTPTESFASFGPQIQNNGWRVIPYMATPGLHDTHPLLPLWAPFRMTYWDKATQQVLNPCWDGNADGQCSNDPVDYWTMNAAWKPYRDFVGQEIADGMLEAFEFDGIYFDFMKSNIRVNDRNSLIGDAPQGYADLCQEVRAAQRLILHGSSRRRHGDRVESHGQLQALAVPASHGHAPAGRRDSPGRRSQHEVPLSQRQPRRGSPGKPDPRNPT